MNKIIQNLKYDLPASIVVFLVALPLCLGIAMASGAPLFSGIIAGVVGGIVVGIASGSNLGVSGPAAGLAVIVLNGIEQLGSFNNFLVATSLAGILQIIMGLIGLGSIAYYFPSSIIKGMLCGIGVIICLKQIPHALGYDVNFANDFNELFHQNPIITLQETLNSLTPNAIIISIISLAVIIFWDKFITNKFRQLKAIPSPLLVILIGIILSNFLEIKDHQIVQIPISQNAQELMEQLTLPNFEILSNPQIYSVALVIAIIASIETLLCVEATDKLDPKKNITPTNRELKAQGLGNLVSGLIGGLPVTQVIVRSSANISFNAKTKLSAILHGFFLLICVVAIPNFLNMIPLASLACVLLVVGYKLINPKLIYKTYHLGYEQFIPFILTISCIVIFDLLKGVIIGMVIALGFILMHNFRNAFDKISDHENKKHDHIIKLAQEVSFLNKGAILKILNEMPDNSTVIIDASSSKVIDYDVYEVINDFRINAKSRNINLQLKGINFNKI
ncbi:MAG: SulP family inorganic anion transporter [Alphaproteobacteria bacterium]